MWRSFQDPRQADGAMECGSEERQGGLEDTTDEGTVGTKKISKQMMERQDLSSDERITCMEATGEEVHEVGSAPGRDGGVISTYDIGTGHTEPWGGCAESVPGVLRGHGVQCVS